MVRLSTLALGSAAGVLAATCLQRAFVAPGVSSAATEKPTQAGTWLEAAEMPAAEGGADGSASPVNGVLPFLAGVCLGLVLLVVSPGKAAAEIEDVSIAVDPKGTTTTLSKEQLVRGKRLFNAACGTCHVGGGTRTNQNVGLSTEELAGAAPSRTNVQELVNFLNAPMTYDGLYDISENHPAIKSADIFPKMRAMKQKDLVDISSYILYQNQTIPEKWGGGKTYY